MYKVLLCDTALSYLADNEFISYDVDIANSEEDIYTLTYKKSYDLYVVNFVYYDVISTLKKSGDTTVTLFVDEYYDIYNLKKAFLIGDDYIIKPVVSDELKARVSYWYRKLFNHNKNIVVYDDFYYHISSGQLYQNSLKVKLSPSVTKLLSLFLCNLNKPIQKDVIFSELETTSDGTLRVYISKLNKLGFIIVYERVNRTYSLKNQTNEGKQ